MNTITSRKKVGAYEVREADLSNILRRGCVEPAPPPHACGTMVWGRRALRRSHPWAFIARTVSYVKYSVRRVTKVKTALATFIR